jgi:glycosyltransferase involved in cell wall biosynthesis
LNSQISVSPKVSIITVVYNAANIIEDTILSVIHQEYTNIQYIIIDGASTDGTIQVIEKYLNNIDLFISERDNGIYDAMNKGIRYVTGDWVLFLNSGDTLSSNRILDKIFYKSNISGDIIYSDVYIKGRNLLLKNAYELKNFSHLLPFCHQACFTRVEILKKRQFDLKYKIASDYDFFLYWYKEGKDFIHFDEPIAIFLVGGLSSRASYEYIREYFNIIVKMNSGFELLHSLICFFKSFIPFNLSLLKRV